MATARTVSGMPPHTSPLANKGSSTNNDKVQKVQKGARARGDCKPGKATYKCSSPEIKAPLSELTKDMAHIPIKDMEAWVNRPIEVRRREVSLKNGKIARPMNSFMLYRSAFAERTKEWCSQNNHQIVSRVSGQSWPLEPREIREKFEILAIIERDNHQKAHPEYKFAPNKNQTPLKKKRNHDEDDASGANDQANEVQPMLSRARKRTRCSEIGTGYNSRGTTPYDARDLAQTRIYNQSPWQGGNNVRSITAPLSPPEQTHYLPGVGHQPVIGSHVEESRYAKVALAESPYRPTATLAGIPGTIHHDLLGAYSNVTTPSQIDESQLDPQLLAIDHDTLEDACGAVSHIHYTLWQPENGPSVYLPVSNGLQPSTSHYAVGLSCYPAMSAMEDGQGAWNLSDELVSEAGMEFDRWLNTQPSVP